MAPCLCSLPLLPLFPAPWRSQGGRKLFQKCPDTPAKKGALFSLPGDVCRSRVSSACDLDVDWLQAQARCRSAKKRIGLNNNISKETCVKDTPAPYGRFSRGGPLIHCDIQPPATTKPFLFVELQVRHRQSAREGKKKENTPIKINYFQQTLIKAKRVS